MPAPPPSPPSSVASEKLGRLLVAAQLLSEDQLQRGIIAQKKTGGRLGSILVRMGFLDEGKLLTFLSQQFGLPSVDLSQVKVDPALLKLIPAETIKKYRVLPIKRAGAVVTLAMADPSDVFALDDIKFLTGYTIEPVVASESAIVAAIQAGYGQPQGSAKPERAMMLDAKDYTVDDMAESTFSEGDEGPTVDVADFDQVVGDALDNVDVVEEQKDEGADTNIEAPIIKLVNGLLINAIKVGASDIHMEPYETVFRVRFRVDGALKTVMNLPLKIRNAAISRVKIMSKLDIAERRLPQDGRIKLKLGKKRDVDFRVSVLPCLFGEKVVMRILDKSNLQLDLTKMGFEVEALEHFMKAINSPYGMVLVTGPTGSGKSTTLYSALQQINQPDINIMTAEDPVEYNLMGINQVQMKDDIGLNFAAALRSFLRQDPDVVMVGEIRDYETAEIAVKAALTGHLVLSTLHTNDAPSTINRLLNMGIEPFMVASSVVLILAQRLARRICSQCKEEVKVSQETLVTAGFSPSEAGTVKCFHGKGCQTCGTTGYKGRVALYEVMPVGEELRELVLQGGSADEIKRKAVELGMKTLRMSGLQKVREGLTTVEEVVGTTFAD
ncbi:MAG: type IV-A pilus assembly ATPase PilB [Nitrospirae bacterium RIFCSPHIGHO2_01_FULL_66_17]|nr:MAG: type IV-A pilus assembly ATPase PilB [Nitrospirae bacterium RIFCSPHIGHO2_01_FULL_66_17]